MGLYLVFSFGTWARNNYAFLPSSQTLALCATAASDASASLKQCPIVHAAVVRFQHAIIITAFGIAVLLFGIGRLVTLASRELTGQPPTPRTVTGRRRRESRLATAARACWTVGKSLLVPACKLLLLVVLLTFITSLARGLAPSLDLLDAAIERAVDVALGLVGVVLIALPLPFS